jgi:hypothetical protein
MTDTLEQTTPQAQTPAPVEKVKRAYNRKPIKESKLASAAFSYIGPAANAPWSPTEVDKMESVDLKEFRKVVEACRFFYRRDPLASTVINKLVDIGINELEFAKNGISETEYKIYEAIEEELLEFAEVMALEFLLSGLVIPEIKYAPVGREALKAKGIKRYELVKLPVAMWVRDPSSIVINKTIISEEPTYYLEIPDDLIYFIHNEGKYPDGKEDKELYLRLQSLYPKFFAAVEKNEHLFKLDAPLAIRRRATSDSPYPLPYLYPAIEPLKHKRNLRRMDYSIASRMISAIQVIKLGSDLFPLTEESKDQLEDIKGQMTWANSTGRDVERIFQLFSNHTLEIAWVTPPVDVLLNDAKYKDINQDIIFAMGFPKILITGETEKANTSDAQFASISPVKTMDNFRRKIRDILQAIVNEIANLNNFKTAPEIDFKPLQLIEFKTFIDAVSVLYQSGNISRESYADILGFNWKDEMDAKIEEQKVLEDSGLPEFAPQAFSPAPGDGTNNNPAIPSKNTSTKPPVKAQS